MLPSYPKVHSSERDVEASITIRESIQIQVPVIVQGPIGCGKTHLIQRLATEYDATLTVLGVSGDAGDLKLLLGTFITGPNNSFIWKRGLLTLAVEEGHWVLFKDISHQSSTEIIAMLATLLQERILVIPSRSERIVAHSSFRLFITQTDGHILYPGLNCLVSLPPRTASETISIMSYMLLSIPNSTNLTSGQCKQISEFVYTAASLNKERVSSMSDLVKAINRLLPHLVAGNGNEEHGLSLDLRQKILEISIDLFALSVTNYDERYSLQMAIARILGLSQECDLKVILESELGSNRDSYSLKGLENHQSTQGNIAMMKQTKMLLNALYRGVSSNEPMLLVGPTGTGKTTIVQYLSELEKPPGGLFVVNLHAQTEHSDLFGSWSQQSSTTEIMKRAMDEFGFLFEASGHKREANGTLFSKLIRWASCCHTDPKSISSFWTQIATISKLILSKMGHETSHEKISPISAEVCDRWNELIAMALRFSGSPCSATFVFAEGVILKALQTGAWLLLDEINLAPPSLLLLLESLVAGHPVRVFERGDERPVFRHPSFRLFACMNGVLSESTRRALPESLRAKFTEITIDPIERFPEDVRLLVDSRLKASMPTSFVPFPGFELGPFFVSVYYRIRKGLADRELCGPEEPSWTIRSLCRLVDAWQQFMSPPQSGSVLWALKQAIMVVVGGQLDSSSVKFLLCTIISQLIDPQITFLLSQSAVSTRKSCHVESGSMVSITGTDDGEYCLFLPKGPLEVEKLDACTGRFIETQVAHKCMLAIARVFAASIKRPWALMLVGPTSAGKTTAVAELARRTGHRLIRINNHEHTDVSEYLGAWGFSHVDDEAKMTPMISECTDGFHSSDLGQLSSSQASSSGSCVPKTESSSASNPIHIRFAYGALVRAMLTGSWLLLDELNLAPTEVLESLNRLLDDNRELYIPETGETIRPHPSFRLFATLNPHGRGYGGRHVLSEAFKSRWIILQVEEDPAVDDIIRGRSGGSQSSWLAPAISAKMASVFMEIRKRRRAGSILDSNSLITLRDMFRWAFRIKQLSDADASRGAWLLAAQAGWSLLGERLRTEVERRALQDLLIENFPMASSSPSPVDSRDWLFSDYGRWPGVPALGSFSRGIVWTGHFQRVGALAIAAIRNREPLLLVGETGTGKTSIVQWLAESQNLPLHTVACHQYTDVGDFLGMQRPCASIDSDSNGKRHRGGMPSPSSWVWVDGPLVTAMREGHILLVDEISLAEDSVLERLNSVLESDNRMLTVVENFGGSSTEPMVIQAHPNFALIATMNPSGDFGKRELSPALRNRFTEVWVPSPASSIEVLLLLHGICSEDVAEKSIPEFLSSELCNVKEIPKCILAFCSWFLSSLNRSNGQFLDLSTDEALIASFSGFVTPAVTLSIRDLKTWIEFIKINARGLCPSKWSSASESLVSCKLSVGEAYCQGAEMIFLDGLSMLANSGGVLPFAISPENISSFRKTARTLLARHGALLSPMEEIPHRQKIFSTREDHSAWGIAPFYVAIRSKKTHIAIESHPDVGAFSLSAPTVIENAYRVFRAMQISHRPILLEGDPGVGKTSLISAIAKRTGNESLVRINLSEQTDLSDLFGVDMPSGSLFSWRDGPLLAGIKAGHWILLDEINLASQQVLEGLNSILDHRGTIYVAELNRSWKIDSTSVRIFATQNSRREGGGRKGLPQSFLNRFTRVYLEPLSEADLVAIVKGEKDQSLPVITNAVKTAMRLNATFSPQFDFNLRDVSRLLSLNPTNQFTLRRAEELVFGARFDDMPGLDCGDAFDATESNNYRLFLSVRNELRLPLVARWLLQNRVGDAIEIALHKKWLVLLRSPDASAFPMSLSEIIHHFADTKGAVLHSIPLTALSETSDFLGGFEQQPDQELGAGFHWKNGVLLDALEKGHWIFFENASACPSSVLDRLNGLFEPNGSLFVHEKSGFGDPMIPHPNFRAFMGVSSCGSGSISRPMRNRALEICVGNLPPPSILDTMRFLWMRVRHKFGSDLEFYGFAKWLHAHAMTVYANDDSRSEYFKRLLLQLRKSKCTDKYAVEEIPCSSLIIMQSLSMPACLENGGVCLFLQKFVKCIFDDNAMVRPILFEFHLAIEALTVLYASGNNFPSERDIFSQKLSLLSFKGSGSREKQDLSAMACRMMLFEKFKAFHIPPCLGRFFNLVIHEGECSDSMAYFSLWRKWFSNPAFLARKNGLLWNSPLASPEHVFPKNRYSERRLMLSSSALLAIYSAHEKPEHFCCGGNAESSETMECEPNHIFGCLNRFYGTVALYAVAYKNVEVLDLILTIESLPRPVLYDLQYYLWSLVPSSPLYAIFQKSQIPFMLACILKLLKLLCGDISMSILEAAFDVYSLSSGANTFVEMSGLSRTFTALGQFNDFFASAQFACFLKQIDNGEAPELICDVLSIDGKSTNVDMLRGILHMLSELCAPVVDPILFPVLSPIFAAQAHLNIEVDMLVLQTFQLVCGSLNHPEAFDEQVKKVLFISTGLSDSIDAALGESVPSVFDVSVPYFCGIISQFTIFKNELLSKLPSHIDDSSFAAIDLSNLHHFLLSLLSQIEQVDIPFDIVGSLLLPLILLSLLKIIKPNRFSKCSSISAIGPLCSFGGSFSSPLLGKAYMDWAMSYSGASRSNLNILYSFLYAHNPCSEIINMKIADVYLPKDVFVLTQTKMPPFILTPNTIYDMLFRISSAMVSLNDELRNKIATSNISDFIVSDFTASISSLLLLNIDFCIVKTTSWNALYECITTVSSKIMTCIETGYEVARLNDKTGFSSWLVTQLDALSRLLIEFRKQEIALICSMLLQEDTLYFSDSLASFSLDQFVTLFRESLRSDIDFESLFKLLDAFVLNTSIVEARLRIELLFALFHFHERNGAGRSNTALLNVLWHGGSYFNAFYVRKIASHISKESAVLLSEIREKATLISCSYLNEMIVRQCSDKIHHLTSRSLKALNEMLTTPTVSFISSCKACVVQVGWKFDLACNILPADESIKVLAKASRLFSAEMERLWRGLKISAFSESILSSLLESATSAEKSTSFLRNQKLNLFSSYIKECKRLGLLNCVPVELQSGILSPLSNGFNTCFLNYPVLLSAFKLHGNDRAVGEAHAPNELYRVISNIEANFVGFFEFIPGFKKAVISISGLSTIDQTSKIHRIVGTLFEWLCINSVLADSKVSRFHLLACKLVGNWSVCNASQCCMLVNSADVFDVLCVVELISNSMPTLSIENVSKLIGSLKSELVDMQHKTRHFDGKNAISNEFVDKLDLLLTEARACACKHGFITSLSTSPLYEKRAPLERSDSSSCAAFTDKILLLAQHVISVLNSISIPRDVGFGSIENTIPQLYVLFKMLFSDAFYASLHGLLDISPNPCGLPLMTMLVSMLHVMVRLFLIFVNSLSELSIHTIASIAAIYENNFGEVSTSSKSDPTTADGEGCEAQQGPMRADDGTELPKGMADCKDVPSQQSKNVSNEIEYEEQISDVKQQSDEKHSEQDPEADKQNDIQPQAENEAAVSTSEKMDGMQDCRDQSEFEKNTRSDQNDALDEAETEGADTLAASQEDRICDNQFKEQLNEEEDSSGMANDEILEKLNTDSFPQHLDQSIWQDDLSSDNELSEVDEGGDFAHQDATPAAREKDLARRNDKSVTEKPGSSSSCERKPKQEESSLANVDLLDQDKGICGVDANDVDADDVDAAMEDNLCKDRISMDEDVDADPNGFDTESKSLDADPNALQDHTEGMDDENIEASAQPMDPYQEEALAYGEIPQNLAQFTDEEKSPSQGTNDDINSENIGIDCNSDNIGTDCNSEKQDQFGKASNGQLDDASNKERANLIDQLLELPPQHNDLQCRRILGDQLATWRDLLMSLENSAPNSAPENGSQNPEVFEYDLDDPLASNVDSAHVLSQISKEDFNDAPSSSALNNPIQGQRGKSLPLQQPFDQISLNKDNDGSHSEAETCNANVEGLDSSFSTIETEPQHDCIEDMDDDRPSEMVLSPGYRNHNWPEYLHATYPLACELTEKLRMVLDPTIAGKLQGDYKTGKRLNMKKVIPYIASGYRRDKIWLRRTKPSKRNYQILISVDQSLSMESSGAPHLLFQVIALLSQAFSKIEVGHVGLAGFGAETHSYIALPGCSSDSNFCSQFNENIGDQILANFHFNAESTNLLSLLSKSLQWFEQAKSASFSACSQIHFILTDGIFNNSDQIRKLLNQFSAQRILVIFLLLDARSSRDSILELKSVAYEFDGTKPIMKITKYIDQFPAKHYLVIRDISTLPSIFCKCLREWIEGINRTSVCETFRY